MKINSIIDLVKDLDTSRQTKNLNKLLIRILLHLQVEFSKVVNAYCMHCDSLPTEAFNWYCSITPVYLGKKYQQVHFELGYVKKCISTSPVLCYRFISSQRYFDTEDASLVDDEVVNVLLEIYKKLSLHEDTDAMNEVLDLFDEYIYRDNRVMKAAVSLLT